MKRKILIMAAGAIMALLPIQAQKKFVFTPQWTAQAQFAGYYVAKERGFYKQAGLDEISFTLQSPRLPYLVCIITRARPQH